MLFIREKFIEVLKKNSLSQKDFCDRAGVSVSTLKRVLNKGYIPEGYLRNRIVNTYRRLDHYGIDALNYFLKDKNK